jgi:hypothetical protein
MSSGKYQPLTDWLAGQPATTGTLTPTFTEVVQILGAPLPVSAQTGTSWWNNYRLEHSQVQAWLAAGWEVTTVDRRGHRVTFTRTAGEASS